MRFGWHHGDKHGEGAAVTMLSLVASLQAHGQSRPDFSFHSLHTTCVSVSSTALRTKLKQSVAALYSASSGRASSSHESQSESWCKSPTIHAGKCGLAPGAKAHCKPYRRRCSNQDPWNELATLPQHLARAMRDTFSLSLGTLDSNPAKICCT